MLYDPIKDRLGTFFSQHPSLQRLFYGLLNLLFLRAWYVRRALRRLLGSYPSEAPLRVLDAGTGFGQYAYFVARSFPNASVTAVDVKKDYLERARRFVDETPQRRQITFREDDLTQLKTEGPFDLVLSVDVMEHIDDDRAVLSHFERVLAPGGHVVINTPSDRGGSDVSDEGDDSFIEEHVRDGYAMEDLLGKLDEAGLQTVRSMYTYGPYGAAAWQMLIKRPLQMLGASWSALLILPLYYAVILPAGLLLNLLDMRQDNDEGTGLLIIAQKPRQTG